MFIRTSITLPALVGFSFGILIGCAAVGSMLVSTHPPIFAPYLLSWSVALAPLTVFLLWCTAAWPPLMRYLPVMLFLTGITIPADLAFLSVTGFLGEQSLRVVVGVMMVLAAVTVAFPVSGIHLAKPAKRSRNPLPRIEPVVSA